MLGRGTNGQQQQYHVQKKEATPEARKEGSKDVQYTDSSNIDNHHNIPRQYYNGWDGTSPGGNGNSDNGGSGR